MMGGDLSIVRLVLQASYVVQFVLLLLGAASLVSWTIIFRKRMMVRRAQQDADRFENSFWSGGDLVPLYRQIETRGNATGMESIFESGFREFARLRQQGGVATDMLLEGARRGMRVAQIKEIDRLEHSLATLATVGSTSPYVGLFGTVWGIMSAFSSLGNVQQATLAAVAPGMVDGQRYGGGAVSVASLDDARPARSRSTRRPREARVAARRQGLPRPGRGGRSARAGPRGVPRFRAPRGDVVPLHEHSGAILHRLSGRYRRAGLGRADGFRSLVRSLSRRRVVHL